MLELSCMTDEVQGEARRAGATHLPLSFCISSLISSISGVTSKSLPPAEILHLPSLLRLQQTMTISVLAWMDPHHWLCSLLKAGDPACLSF